MNIKSLMMLLCLCACAETPSSAVITYPDAFHYGLVTCPANSVGDCRAVAIVVCANFGTDPMVARNYARLSNGQMVMEFSCGEVKK